MGLSVRLGGVALSAIMGCLTSANHAAAQPISSRFTLQLDYKRAPQMQQCPDEKVLRAEVVRLLEVDPFQPNAAYFVTTELHREGRLFLGLVKIRNRNNELLWSKAFSTAGYPCEELVLKMAFSIVIGFGVLTSPPAELIAAYQDRIRQDDKAKTGSYSQAPTKKQAPPITPPVLVRPLTPTDPLSTWRYVGVASTAVGIGLGTAFTIATYSTHADVKDQSAALGQDESLCRRGKMHNACEALKSNIELRNLFGSLAISSFVVSGILGGVTLSSLAWARSTLPHDRMRVIPTINGSNATLSVETLW